MKSTNAVATITTLHTASPNIANRFYLDNGQRDGFYDHGKIIRKQGEPAPNNALTIIFDYFVGGDGDFYDVGFIF